MDKIRVIMTGPMPPNVGGMATVLGDLCSSKLSTQVDLVFFNTAKTTREGRKLTEAVLSKLALWSDWFQLLKIRPKTIAHIHTCSGFTFFLDCILICLTKCCAVPVVLHIHGGKFDLFLDGLHPLLLGATRWLCRRCDLVVVLSNSWQVSLKQRLGAQRFSVIPNGVPISHDFSRYPQNHRETNVLFLGNLTEGKGVFDLLEVMQHVDHAVLHMVGGEEQAGFANKLRQLIEDKCLHNKVKLYGVKLGQEKQQFFQNADVFILPSYAEGLPMALLEAMASGLPVIVSSVGGMPSVVRDGEEGFLITAGNQEQIVTMLNRLISDPELRLKMGKAARKRCQVEFGIEITVEKLLNSYTQIFPDCESIG